MASITTWMRLEPHARAADMEAGLEMRIHDPLWLLARQWQFGEFKGEDTGSPVWAAFKGTEMPISLYLPGPLDGHSRDDVQDYTADLPLEYLVERERTLAQTVLTSNRRLAVEAGQHFLRLLGSLLANRYRAGLLTTHGLEALTEAQREKTDSDSLSFLDLMAGRSLDGARLLKSIQALSAANAAVYLDFDSDDRQAAAQTITTWLTWCEQFVGPVAPANAVRSAWNPERMEYACALAAPTGSASDQVVLTAEEYPGGHLDWYSFDAISGQKLQRNITSSTKSFADATLPTTLSFRGMPSSRLWEFEDARVSFGSIQAAPTDLARILLVEFLISYGNDFFTIPISLETGSIYSVTHLAVTNTFGEIIEITTTSAQNDWLMFALSTDSTSSRPFIQTALFLPPTLGQHLNSPPIEDLHLLRDEMANTAWAVEHIVESESGKPMNRREAYLAQRELIASPDQPHAEGTLVYRLDTWQTSLPDYWLPLIPELSAPGQSRVRLACYDSQGHSRGRLLAEHAPEAWLYLFEEEVPRMGAHISRVQQYTRWYNSRMFAWIGREKRLGRGEGSSGLAYDVIETISSAQTNLP